MPLSPAPKPKAVAPVAQSPIVPPPAPAPAPAPVQAPAPAPTEDLMAPNAADSQMAALAVAGTNEEVVLGLSDMAIPRLVLAQPTSSFEGAMEHIGQWFNSVTGEFFESMDMVIVRVVVQRAVFPEPYDANIPIMCASRDAITPYAEYMGKQIDGVTINGPCAECPLADWGEEDPITGKGKPPRCTLMYVYTGIEVETGMPFSMRLKGTAMTAAKKLNFLFTQFKHSQVLHLGTMKGKGSKVYYVPTIALAKQATPPYIVEIAESILNSRPTMAGPAEPVEGTPGSAVTPPDDDIPF